jgi:hypothetical protein
MELARIFNPPFVIHSSYISKSIRESMSRTPAKILLFEGGKTNSIEDSVVKEGIDGIKRFLNHLEMRSFKEVGNQREPIFIKEHKWLRAPNSGMFQSSVKNGEKVNAGAILGIVTDPFGKIEKRIKSPMEGYVFCVNESPVVNKGDAIFHIGKKVEYL